MKPWKQIKIFTSNSEQSAMIQPDENKEGIILTSSTEYPINSAFMLYMTREEAVEIGEELIRYAKSL